MPPYTPPTAHRFRAGRVISWACEVCGHTATAHPEYDAWCEEVLAKANPELLSYHPKLPNETAKDYLRRVFSGICSPDENYEKFGVVAEVFASWLH